ncbi:MAG: hypothetical protein AUG09_03490 [Acidobacteria bacterium 13_1_20CM_2_68_7]|nr:MAG: hypothetical protein AUG09_03490 [Acidobacteria bacterium 13_1_20CM_2_68_7]
MANGKEAEYRRRPDQRLRQGAHLMVGAALRLGVLRKRPCRCGTREVQAHHEDYSRPLKVMWLCAACHARHHQHLRTKGVGVMQRFLALRL